jgi:GNAT superfamily N-acetyltransferase
MPMLDWARNNWMEREGTLITELNEFQEDLINALDINGFKSKGVVAITRKYNLCDREDIISLGESFSVTDMISNNDYKRKRLLQKSAFRNENTVSEFDLLTYEYNRESPIYNPYYDLSVINKNGDHVSGCLAFVDYENKYGEIERVCTHSDYRKMGLCETVIKECFRRLKKESIEYAYITGYSKAANGLYEKIGAVDSKKWFHYELE